MVLNRIIMGLVVALLCIAIGLQLAFLLSQREDEATETCAQHPLTGSWVMQTDDGEPPALISFFPSGIVQHFDGSGRTGLGAWSATGPTSATSTVLFQNPGGDDVLRGWRTIRASVDVKDDGTGFVSIYTIEISAAGNGASSGQIGPGTAEGQRITPEPVGSPVVPLRTLQSPPSTMPTAPLSEPELLAIGAVTMRP